MRKRMLIVLTALALGGGAAFAAAGPELAGKVQKTGKICTGMWLEHTDGVISSVIAVKHGVEVLIISTDPAVAANLRKEAPAYYAKKRYTDCDCCAAALPGSDTTVENIDNGIKVTITSDDPEVAARIKARSGTMVHPVKPKKAAPPVAATQN